jgi:hypothetical protein
VRSRQEYIPASSIATIYIGLGELEEASNWMDRAIANREGNLSILNVVAFDQIRQHPDFPDWLAQIGLPQID